MYEKRAALPPLNALRAFEAIGHHLSLARAADELCVTASALSHQLAQLEQQLQVKLFSRTGRGLAFTEEGRVLHEEVAACFGRLSRTIERIRPGNRRQALTVSMLSTFAMRWLIPRLSDFQQRNPELDVRITTSIALVDFQREQIDCAVRFGAGRWPGVASDFLFREQLAPVCTPALAQQLRGPTDLSALPLLHSKQRPDDWRVWLSAQGVSGGELEAGLMFETRNFAIQAAEAGLGVAVVDPALVADELQAGRLVLPFPEVLPGPNGYYFVYPDDSAPPQKVLRFREWLLGLFEQRA
jgi:LysR family glycine cleavage system transcriptional activator